MRVWISVPAAQRAQHSDLTVAEIRRMQARLLNLSGSGTAVLSSVCWLHVHDAHMHGALHAKCFPLSAGRQGMLYAARSLQTRTGTHCVCDGVAPPSPLLGLEGRWASHYRWLWSIQNCFLQDLRTARRSRCSDSSGKHSWLASAVLLITETGLGRGRVRPRYWVASL